MSVLAPKIIQSWKRVALRIAAGQAPAPKDRDKEKQLFHAVKADLEQTSQGITVALNVRLGNREIDLVASKGDDRVTAEGKFKVRTDGAVPDNRKAAFFDLYKLERCVASGRYSSGLFLWLTDHPGYLKQATGDSRDFSTHQGRVYSPGRALNARRARDGMPLPLTLQGEYVFDWRQVHPPAAWCSLELRIGAPTLVA